MISPTGENLVFLLSLPRSGSTLLSVLLDGHSRISSPPEPWFMLPLANLVTAAARARDFGGEHAALATRDFLGDDGLRDCSRAFGCEAYNRHLRQNGKVLLVDKTPRYYHIIDQLEVIFPAARRIWLLRDPLDVAASYKSSWKIGSAELSGETFTQFSYDFLLGLPAILKHVQRPAKRDHVVKYEELVAQPARVMRDLCGFLGQPFEENAGLLKPGAPSLAAQRKARSGDRKILQSKKIHAASVGSWRAVLDSADLGRLCRIVGREAFETLGHPQTLPALQKAKIKVLPEATCRRNRTLRIRQVELGRAHRVAQLQAGQPEAPDQAGEIAALNERVKKYASESEARFGQIKDLTKMVHARENDATARLRQVEQLSAQLQHLSADNVALRGQLAQLTKLVKARQQDADDRIAQIKELTGLVHTRERDSTARLRQVEHLAGQLQALNTDNQALRSQLAQLTKLVKARQQDADDRAAQNKVLTKLAQGHERDATDRLKQVEQLSARLQALDTDSQSLRSQVGQLTKLVKARQQDADERIGQNKELTRLVHVHEKDASARLRQVEQLSAQIQALDADNQSLRGQVGQLTKLVKARQQDADDRIGQTKELTRLVHVHEQDASARLQQVEQLSAQVQALDADNQALRSQVGQLTKLVDVHEKDATARLRLVEQLSAQVQTVNADSDSLRSQLEVYAGWLKDARLENQVLAAAHREVEKTAHAVMKQLDEIKRAQLPND